MFECLVGYPPFCSESTHDTYKKIIDWQTHLQFPDDVHLSRESEDLIRRSVPYAHSPSNLLTASESRLITSQDKRLDVNGIRNHSFFYGVDWDIIREIDAPFVPNLRSMTDTSYFPTDELSAVPDQPVGADTSGAHKDLAFLGYAQKHQSANASHLPSIMQIYLQALFYQQSGILMTFKFHVYVPVLPGWF